jgi:peptidoglycan/xylan/chitin deacetylase (PgdA/CDA1 family)
MSNILILMFHRVFEPRLGYDANKFETYLNYLLENFNICLPFDKSKSIKPKLTLTFDDAYYDFYHYVYPKLKQYNIPAVLAVSPYFINNDANVESQTRLNSPYPESMFDTKYRKSSPFCTWIELSEMVQSGLVELAGHGFEHKNLADINTDFEQEVVKTKEIIAKKCNTIVRGFIYPFGKCSKDRHKKVLEHYDYAMRIGSAINKKWRDTLYRIDAEHFWPNNIPFQSKNFNKWTRKYWLNRLRGK